MALHYSAFELGWSVMFIRFLRDCRGNFTILAAIMMTSLVGVAGLVTDYGNGLFNRMKDQRVADIAAVSGGNIYASSGSQTAMTTAADNIATLNGYSTNNVSVQLVSSPNGDGNNAVEVTVSSSVPLLLSKLLTHTSTLSVSATSYAELESAGGTGCILALDPTANQAITISGSANVQATHCDVISNSSSSSAIDMSGSAVLNTPCTVSVGQQVTTSGLTLTSCSKPVTGATASADPYASIPSPTLPSVGCLSVPTPPTDIGPGWYCNGMNISGTATFQGGFYYIQHNLAFQGGSNVSLVAGSIGATFFIEKSGTTAISGSAVVNLKAQATGTYAGILFFGDRTANTSNNNNISGSSGSILNGALYFPTQYVTYSGGSASASCTQVIGDIITFSGATTVNQNCSGIGTLNIVPHGTGTKVSLVQ